jgi:hypothetical protein
MARCTRCTTSCVVLDDNLVVIVHRHDASPAHHPADGDSIRHGCRVYSAPTIRAGAENERKPCNGDRPDEDAVCRKWCSLAVKREVAQ